MAPVYEPKAKRRKIDAIDVAAKPTVHSAGDLHDLLQFKQTSSADVKNGIQKFKEFLTDISKTETEPERSSKLRILKGYCDDQSSGATHARCFPDLISTWSFAAQSNNDSILSAVPAVLSLFLKTVSTQIEFREFGLSLCRTLLEKEQLRLFDRGLTSAKTKEFLISPCLRLLTEIVSFDGGAVANSLHSRRETVFKRLDALLDPAAITRYEGEEQRRKPTVRRNAQRYVLANLKFQSSDAKDDLIAEGKILRRTLHGINRDGSDIISDILRSVKNDVLDDTALSRKSKKRFLSTANLTSLASLYNIEDEMEPSEANRAVEDKETAALQHDMLESRKGVRNQVHNLLLAVCIKQEYGVLLPDSGWYPFGSDPEEPIGQDNGKGINLGLDSPLYFDNYARKVPVKNGTLSTFIEGLRPTTDPLQAALLLKIFETAPELVADFFSKKAKFMSEPRTETGWLGEAAFLYSVIELPVPAHCGWEAKLPAIPPPISIVTESMLPRPLDRQTVTRCLNINNEVITIFAARVVTVALEKLQRILALFRTAGPELGLWKQASDRLQKAFSKRCPQMKVIIQALQRAPRDNLRQRGALIDLLAMYFRVLPGVALREKFDASTALTEILNRLDGEAKDVGEESELLERISSLVFVAEISPSTNWWNKSGSELSLICRLLRTVASSSVKFDVKPIKVSLGAVLVGRGVIPDKSRTFDALLSSLNPSKTWSPSLPTYAFIDNCIGRVVRQPVHYLDLSALILGKDTESGLESVLIAAIAEQWPFIAKNDNLDVQKNIAEWISRFFFSGLRVDEPDATLSKNRKIIDEMIAAAQGTPGSTLEKAFKKQIKHPIKLDSSKNLEGPQTNTCVEPGEVKDRPSKIILENIFGMPPRSPNSLQGLDRWENADLESAVSSGRLSRLVRCVASTEEEIRRQAFLILRRLMVAVKESSYSERGPVYLLLGEVCETVQEHGLETTIPSVISELASQAIIVLANPSHKMYGKINKFLNKAPSWDAQKVISYWIDKILLREPEDDDGHELEISWLLELLINGLQTSEDMELYRKSNVLERMLSLYCSPQVATKPRHKILQIVYQTVQVGGSMTLVTRAGILSWIEIQMSSSTKETDVLQALKSAIENSTDQVEVSAWKTRFIKS